MKPTLKNTFSTFIAAALLFILLFSCRTEGALPCTQIEKPVSLDFPNDTITDIRILPFEPGKIWVQSRQRMVEVDLHTGQKTALSSAYRNFFNVENAYSEVDPYDSLMWIGGQNRNVLYYDSKTKKIVELPVNYAHRIIARPDKVYFVAFHQLCYWDRRSKTIHQVPDMPLKFIQSCEMVDDTTVILERQYTYYLNSGRIVKGIFAGTYEFQGYNRINDGLALLYKDNATYHVLKGEVKTLPLPIQQYSYNTTIADGIYWQWDDEFCYAFDPHTQTSEKFFYRLPPVNQYNTSVGFDAEYIWIQRPGQLMLIDISSHQQLEFKVPSKVKFVKTVPDDCNVYTVFENRILVMSREDFIKMCRPFDVDLYNTQLVQLNKSVDSLGLTKDTVVAVALKKLNFIKEKYAAIDNVEVKQKLAALDYQAFQYAPLHFPEEHERCYRDGSLPFIYRKACLNGLIDQYGRKSEFKKVVYLEKEFYKYFGKPNQDVDYSFMSHVDSVRKYLHRVDSLEKLALSADSLYYFKAHALEIICRTEWYCQQSCAGCDYSLVTNPLKSFAQKFPQSNLTDNAEFDLIPFNFMYNEEEEDIKRINRDYRAFAIKYPDSDLLADVWYNMFQNYQSLSTPDKKGMKESGQKFIREFGSDKRANEVREELKASGM